MRFYNLVIGAGPRGNPATTFTSFPNGQFDPGALQIEFDAQVAPLHAPKGATEITVHGVGIQTVFQGTNFSGAPVSLYGGFGPGLPLATQAYQAGQQGLLFSGVAVQAYGNWVGVDQALTLVVYPSLGTQNDPLPYVWNCAAGVPIGPYIIQTLNTALPASAPGNPQSISVNISPNLVLPEADAGYYQTLSQFAKHLNQLSRAVLDPTGTLGYGGVRITVSTGLDQINVWDDTQTSNSGQASTPTPAKQINYDDLVGQPTWQGPATVQLWLMMRGDLDVGDRVTMPQALTTTTSQSLPAFRNSATFTGGPFTINDMRHVGNLRSTDATAWITTVNCVPAADNLPFANPPVQAAA